MLENQIYSIESANINQETLQAMKNAGDAMKNIHGKMTIDKVDEIMYVASQESKLELQEGSILNTFFTTQGRSRRAASTRRRD